MKRMKRVLIVGDGRRSRIKKFSERIYELVRPLVETIHLKLDCGKSLSRARADVMIILGGDGAILSAAARMGNNQIPSIGIQMGRFGFLSELTPADWEGKLTRILKGEGTLRERMRLSCVVRGNGKTSFRGLALNDAVIASSSASRMVTVELEIDGNYVTTFHGDGVIVATPVGSTAHSLSAGGPIVEPSLSAFIITPICSHALTIRPLVVRADRSIKLRPKESRNHLSLTLDGQRMNRIGSTEVVRIDRAPVPFQLIRVEGRTYFETLRSKFSWGGTLIEDSGPILPGRVSVRRGRDGRTR